jgi:methyl-accepting chemotaxis protein
LKIKKIKDWNIFAKLAGLIIIIIFPVFLVSIAYVVPTVEKQIYEKRRDNLKSIIDFAYSLIKNYDEKAASGLMTLNEAQKRAIEDLRVARYLGKEYVWINDLQYRLVMHPYKPELEGLDQTNYIDVYGKHIFVEFVNASQSQAGGFVEYSWPKYEGKQGVPKIAFVKRYQPWGWVIGTGLYMDDLQAEISSLRTKIIAALLVIVLIATLIGFYAARKLSAPIKNITDIMQKVAAGDLSQNEIAVGSTDEIGQLTASFNLMLTNLKILLLSAESVAQGKLGSDVTENKLKTGLSLIEAAKVEQLCSGDLAAAFATMQSELRKLTIQAKRIASDELNDPALNNVIRGELGEAFGLMTKNLKELASVAEKISNNDLTVVIHSSDKNVLSKAFAIMTNNLKTLVKELITLSEITHDSANSVAQTTKQVDQTMQQIQNSITQIATATTQVARGTQEISSLIQKANILVETGSTSIGSVIGKFATVKITIQNTNASIVNLEHKSKKITEMVGIITKISDQTNLLALNAAIEAARAGESGRGFAIVADEVRKLAESSAQSAVKISEVIKEIGDDTSNVVASSNESLNEFNSTAGLINSMQEGYKNIVEIIQSVAKQVEQIAAVSQETAASSEEISAGTEEQTAAVTEISNNIMTLLGQVDKLKNEINKFHI